MHGNNRGNAAAIVINVASRGFTPDQLHISGIGGPDRKTNGRGPGVDKFLIRSQPAAMGQIIPFRLLGLAQGKRAITLRGGRVVNLGGDAPDRGVMGGIQGDAPAEFLADLSVIQVDRGPKRGTTVCGRERRHRNLRPLDRSQAPGVPVPGQPGAGDIRKMETDDILEITGSRDIVDLEMPSGERRGIS